MIARLCCLIRELEEIHTEKLWIVKDIFRNISVKNFSPASPSIFLESGVQFFDIHDSIIYCLSRTISLSCIDA